MMQLDRRKEQPDTAKDQDRLREELRESKALAAGFLDCVPGAMIVLDSQWHIVYVNEDAAKLFEADRAALTGSQLRDTYPKKLGHMLSPATIKDLLESREKTTTRYASYLRKWYRISASQSGYGIFIRLEDFTAEMVVNRLLRLNEFSVNRAKDMIFWIKTGGHIIYANMAACETLGYTKKELASLKAFDIDPSLNSHRWAGFVENLRLDGYATYESNLKARDGSEIQVEVTCNYLQYSGDEYLMAFARDISLRKKAENELRESKAEAELYLDHMSHDINNMNQVATGYLELALDTLSTEGKLDKGQSELISKPQEMLANSSKLIDNVRKIRREKAGHYQPAVMELGEIIRNVISSHAQVPGRDITINFNQEGSCKVKANELLRDIFVNMIGNSIKHSTGTLTINLDLAPATVDGKAYCRVAVEDNGPGIPDEQKSQLFREISPDKAKARSKGLGLYLIKQLVRDFEGRFWVEDRIAGDYTKGARFVIMLPATE